METNEILSRLSGPVEGAPLLSEQQTYVNDAGHRVPHDNRHYGTALMTLIFGSSASGKGGGLSESATNRRLRNWANSKFISKLGCGKYTKCIEKQLRSGVDATNYP